jgi:hypothetical protein
MVLQGGSTGEPHMTDLAERLYERLLILRCQAGDGDDLRGTR